MTIQNVGLLQPTATLQTQLQPYRIGTEMVLLYLAIEATTGKLCLDFPTVTQYGFVQIRPFFIG